jgi:hypothetical protein
MDRMKEILSQGSDGEAGAEDRGRKLFYHSGGVTYFKKSTERNFFLILTILALLWAVIDRLGLF